MPRERQIDIEAVAKAAKELSDQLGRPASSREIAEYMGPDKVTKKPWSRQAVLQALNATPEGQEHIKWYNSVRLRSMPTILIYTGEKQDQAIVKWLRGQGIVGPCITTKELTPETVSGKKLVTTEIIPSIMILARVTILVEVDGIPYSLSKTKDLEKAKLEGYIMRGVLWEP